MSFLRVTSLSLLLSVSLTAHPAARAQDTIGAVKAATLAKYHVTQATADHSDIVTPGDQITFLKSGMIMFPATSPVHTLSWHDGKFVAGGFTAFAMVSGSAATVISPAPSSRAKSAGSSTSTSSPTASTSS